LDGCFSDITMIIKSSVNISSVWSTDDCCNSFFTLQNHQTRHTASDGQFINGALRKDIANLESWYSTITGNNDTHAFDGRRITEDDFSELLDKLEITAMDVQQILGLTHEVQDVLKFYTTKADRVRRTASGKSSTRIVSWFCEVYIL